MRVRREALEELLHVLVDEAVARQLLAPGRELLGVRQMAVDQQEGDLGETRLLELFDRVTAVAQDPLVAVDEGDRALAGAGVAVAVVERNRSRLVAQFRDIDPDFTFAAHDHRQLVLLAIQNQFRRAHH